MPRRKRSEIGKPVKQEFTPIQEAEQVTWQTYEQPRFWCPLCSMCADVDRLTEAPHELHMALQRYGGRLPNGKSYMQYFDLPEEDSVRLAAQMIPIVEDVLQYLRGLAGEEEGQVEPIQPRQRRPVFEPEPMPVYDPDDYLDEGEELENEELRELAAERARRRLAARERRGQAKLPVRRGKGQKGLSAPATRQALPPGQPQRKGLKPGNNPKGLPPGRK